MGASEKVDCELIVGKRVSLGEGRYVVAMSIAPNDIGDASVEYTLANIKPKYPPSARYKFYKDFVFHGQDCNGKAEIRFKNGPPYIANFCVTDICQRIKFQEESITISPVGPELGSREPNEKNSETGSSSSGTVFTP